MEYELDLAEEWRPIPGFDGYEASNLGRIRSWRHWPGRTVPRMLTPFADQCDRDDTG